MLKLGTPPNALGGYIRNVSFPGPVTYQINSGAAKATVISGARVFVKSLTLTVTGSAGGSIRLRAFGANNDTLRFDMPAPAVNGQGYVENQDLNLLEFDNGLQIVVDPGVSGTVTFVEKGRLAPWNGILSFSLDTVRRILGKSTPHPFNGLAKWGAFPGQTAFNETWDSTVDNEVFHVQLPAGFTHKGAQYGSTVGGKTRLIVGHHQLKNDPNTVATETTLDELCGERGYLFVSPTSMLSDTWPNDNSVDNLEAVLWWCIVILGANPNDLNLCGFSLGGQQVSRFACTHRDSDGLMARTICAVAPDWEQLVWQRKQHNNTNLGQSVLGTLCDPALQAANNTLWRSQQHRLDQMGGPWPGGDNINAVGLQYRASAILAIDPTSYAETGPMTQLPPTVLPVPSAADIPASTIDFNRSLASSGMWTPMLVFYGDDDALVIIPPLTNKLKALYATKVPQVDYGFQPEFVNVGIFGGGGAHTWMILDAQRYLAFIDRAPPLIRLPKNFEVVTHLDQVGKANFSYALIHKRDNNEMCRVKINQIDTPGQEGWACTNGFHMDLVGIDMAKTTLAQFNFGAGAPIHFSCNDAYEFGCFNMPHLPVTATGTNVGVIVIGGALGPNTIKVTPAGPGPMSGIIT